MSSPIATPRGTRCQGGRCATLSLLVGLVIWMLLSQIIFGYSMLTTMAYFDKDLQSTLPIETASISTKTRALLAHPHPEPTPSNDSFPQVDRIPQRNNTEGMAVCLLIMDDNHYLVEWLAYHYTYLPLRRLIVAVDPKARTSPLSILSRYQNKSTTFINITVWNDKDFLFYRSRATVQKIYAAQLKTHEGNGNPIAAEYLARQLVFNSACLKRLKAENQTWVAMIDTDEYVVVNGLSKKNHRIRDIRPTVLEMLNSPTNRNISATMSSPCIPMNRFNIGVKEEPNRTLTQEGLLNSSESHDCVLPWNYTDLFTFRWRYPGVTSGPNQLPGKCIVDLERVDEKKNRNVLAPASMSPHRPVYDICPKSAKNPDFETSSFVLHQYIGTFEQWTYRNDSRTKRFKRDAYQKLAYNNRHPNDSARFWLKEFVNQLGCRRAQELLQGAGQLA